jgi:hypothetical protein
MPRFTIAMPFAALTFCCLLAANAYAQTSRLADASTSEPELERLVEQASSQFRAITAMNAAPNDMIFGQRGGNFENANAHTPANDVEAARFLTQATFGPTISDYGRGEVHWVQRMD